MRNGTPRPVYPSAHRHVSSARTVVFAMASVLFLFVVLALFGESSAMAMTGGNAVFANGAHVENVFGADHCPDDGNDSGGFHADDHCSVSCSPHVGSSSWQSILWAIDAAPRHEYAVSSPLYSRADAPDPFPPRVSENA